MNAYTGMHWKRCLGMGILASLIYPSIGIGSIIPQPKCFIESNCMGPSIFGKTSCDSCSQLAIPCKSCCSFTSNGHGIISMQRCQPPIGKQLKLT